MSISSSLITNITLNIKLLYVAVQAMCLYVPAFTICTSFLLSPDYIALTLCYCCMPNIEALLLEQEPGPNDFENCGMTLGHNTVNKNTASSFIFNIDI